MCFCVMLLCMLYILGPYVCTQALGLLEGVVIDRDMASGEHLVVIISEIV